MKRHAGHAAPCEAFVAWHASRAPPEIMHGGRPRVFLRRCPAIHRADFSRARSARVHFLACLYAQTSEPTSPSVIRRIAVERGRSEHAPVFPVSNNGAAGPRTGHRAPPYRLCSRISSGSSYRAVAINAGERARKTEARNALARTGIREPEVGKSSLLEQYIGYFTFKSRHSAPGAY